MTDPRPPAAEPLKTRCLFCSLTCPAGLDISILATESEVLSEYLGDDPVTQGRLCFRGHYIAEMAAHPLRLTTAEVKDASAGIERPMAVPMEEATEALAVALRSAGMAAAAIVDGNLPTEEIQAGLELARALTGTEHVCVYLPPTDAAMLRGLRPDTPFLPFEELAKADAFLLVGDVFATHPVASRPVLDARAEQGPPIFAIDCMRNCTAGFARQFLRVRPGGEAFALAALNKMAGRTPAGPAGQGACAEGLSAADLAARAGLDESALRPVAEALSSAKSAAILLDPVPGRTMNVCAAAGAASAMCAGSGARLMPMFRYGNAVGAAAAAAAGGARSMEEVVAAILAGRATVLLSLGVDVLRLLPPDTARTLRSRLATLAVAAPLRNRSTESADIVVPLAAWFEQPGSVLNASGERLRLDCALPPPGGAITVRELSSSLAARLGCAPAESPALEAAGAFQGMADDSVSLPEPTDTGLQLVARSDGPDFASGGMSRLMAWPRYLEPKPELWLSAADAKAAGLSPHADVVIRANGHEARARLRVAADMPEGMAAVSAAFAATRPLFRRREDSVDGEWMPSEAGVSLQESVE